MNELKTVLQALVVELRRLNGSIEKREEIVIGLSVAGLPSEEKIKSAVHRQRGTLL